MFDESLLHGMQYARRGESLDGDDLSSLILNCQRKAGVNALAVDQNCTGAARALIATLLCAGHTKVVAESIEQGNPGLDR